MRQCIKMHMYISYYICIHFGRRGRILHSFITLGSNGKGYGLTSFSSFHQLRDSSVTILRRRISCPKLPIPSIIPEESKANQRETVKEGESSHPPAFPKRRKPTREDVTEFNWKCLDLQLCNPATRTVSNEVSRFWSTTTYSTQLRINLEITRSLVPPVCNWTRQEQLSLSLSLSVFPPRV